MAEKNYLDLTTKTSRLLDFYGALLSSKQREALEYYYNEDLSLAEIADLLKISRQAVHEHIRHGTKTLSDYEIKMGLVQRFQNLNDAVEDLEQELNSSELRILDALEKIKTLI